MAHEPDFHPLPDPGASGLRKMGEVFGAVPKGAYRNAAAEGQRLKDLGEPFEDKWERERKRPGRAGETMPISFGSPGAAKVACELTRIDEERDCPITSLPTWWVMTRCSAAQGHSLEIPVRNLNALGEWVNGLLGDKVKGLRPEETN